MEPNRKEYSMRAQASAPRQSGITVIGFLLMAVLVGAIGLAVIKIVPLYLERMRIERVLGDLQEELATGGNSVQSIRLALEARFYVENLNIPKEEVQIMREGEGYVIKVDREARAPFAADLSFVVSIHEQIEIGR